MRSKKLYIWPFLYLLCILYITILSRTPALFHTVRIIPFWSFFEFFKGYWSRGRSIALNIILFVPFGYLLAKVQGSRKAVLISCLAVTIAIELIQFFSYVGYLDIDDIISNFIGGVIGYAVYFRFDGKLSKIPIPFLALAAGVIGCFIVSGNTQVYETQFGFQITNVVFDEKQVVLEGICDVYRRKGLSYIIQLKDETGEYFTKTEIVGERFTAVAELNGHDIYEIDVIFDGYRPISTKTWINSGTIVEQIVGWLNYSLAFYRKWLKSILAFTRIGSEKELTETMDCGKFKVFSDTIPTQYPISVVMVGMNRGADVIWKNYFRIDTAPVL